MQKRHRRSIQQKQEMDEEGAGDEEREEAGVGGTLYPGLLKEENEDGAGREKEDIGWKKLQNKSWPTTATSISLEEQEEEEEEYEDEEGEEVRKTTRRRVKKMGIERRSLPLEGSRSRSTGRGGRGGTTASSSSASPEFEEPREEGEAPFGGFWESLETNWNRIEHSYIWAAGGFAIFLIVFCLFLIPFFMASNQLTPDQQFKHFETELQKMLVREMPVDSKDQLGRERRAYANRMLLYVADKMLRRNQQENEDEEALPAQDRHGPMTLLMAGRERTRVDRIGREYAAMLHRNWPNYKLLNHSLHSSLTRMELEREVLGPVRTGLGDRPQMILLLLEDIDQLRAASPLFLHSLADPESSPLLATPHNFLILGTLQLTGDGRGKCPEMVESSLLKSWKSATLLEDQIHPIISRISAHSICLD